MKKIDINLFHGIAFDLEGTVIDVEFAHHESHILAAKEVGVELNLDLALEKIIHFIGGPDEEVCKEIYELSDKKYPIPFILGVKKFYYEELLKNISEIKPRKGFMEFLDYLKKGGKKISIGSLTPSNQAKTLLLKSGLYNYFEKNNLVLREDVMNVKPAPDVFLLTAKRMEVSPVHQLVFEDSPRGVSAAIKAGSKVIGMPVYDRPEVIENLYKAGAFKVYLDWEDVLGEAR